MITKNNAIKENKQTNKNKAKQLFCQLFCCALNDTCTSGIDSTWSCVSDVALSA